MENLGEVIESVKNDVNQLKDQMGQMLEALAALKSTRESQVVRNEEATSSNLVMQQIGTVPVPRLDHTGWPPYGLPPNYSPPYEGQSEISCIHKCVIQNNKKSNFHAFSHVFFQKKNKSKVYIQTNFIY